MDIVNCLYPIVAINMKKAFAYLIILIPLISFSQNWQIPEIDWEGKSETENNNIDLLKLKDRNSLIVEFGYSTYSTNGQNLEFIVYQNDGKVKRFVVNQPNTTEKKTKIKRKKIKKKEYKYYWGFLNSCVKENKFKIEKSKLNITEKKGIENGKATVENMYISHRVKYHFWIYQGKNYIAYGSTSPKVYIENKFPGYKERQKLVDLINGFKSLSE